MHKAYELVSVENDENEVESEVEIFIDNCIKLKNLLEKKADLKR